jgi:hypothetical protein
MTATRAPSAAIARAMARPIPEPAPVTAARRSTCRIRSPLGVVDDRVVPESRDDALCHALDVPLDGGRGGVDVARPDDVDEQLMARRHRLEIGVLGDDDLPRQQADERRHAVPRPQEAFVIRGLADEPMERHVESREAHPVAASAGVVHLGDDPFRLPEDLGWARPRHDGDSHRLQRLAERVDLPGVPCREHCHEPAPTPVGGHQAVVFQHPQSIPHRGAAHVQLRRQVRLDEAVARCKRALQDRLSEPGPHAFHQVRIHDRFQHARSSGSGVGVHVYRIQDTAPTTALEASR